MTELRPHSKAKNRDRSDLIFLLVSKCLVQKRLFSGCSKMSRCKASEILRSETYLMVRRNDDG